MLLFLLQNAEGIWTHHLVPYHLPTTPIFTLTAEYAAGESLFLPGRRVTLTINDLRLEEHGTCTFDYVEVRSSVFFRDKKLGIQTIYCFLWILFNSVLYHWFAVLTLGLVGHQWIDTQRPTFGSVMWDSPCWYPVEIFWEYYACNFQLWFICV